MLDPKMLMMTSLPVGWKYRASAAGRMSGFFIEAEEQVTAFYVRGWEISDIRVPLTISLTPDRGAELAATEQRKGTTVVLGGTREAIYHDGWWVADATGLGRPNLRWDTTAYHSLTIRGHWGTIGLRAPVDLPLSTLISSIESVPVLEQAD